MRVNTRGLSPRSRIAPANQRLKYTACARMHAFASLSLFLCFGVCPTLRQAGTFVSLLTLCHCNRDAAIARRFLTCARCKAVSLFLLARSRRSLARKYYVVVGDLIMSRHASFREIADSDPRAEIADRLLRADVTPHEDRTRGLA